MKLLSKIIFLQLILCVGNASCMQWFARWCNAHLSQTEMKTQNQLIIREDSRALYDLLYTQLNTMPPELVKLIIAYDALEFKGECCRIFEHNDEAVICLAQLTDELLAVAFSNACIRIYNVNNGKCVKILQEKNMSLDKIIALPHGLIASCGWDDILRIWNTEKCLHRIPHQRIYSLLAHTNGMLLAGTDQSRIKLFDPSSAEHKETMSSAEKKGSLVLSLAECTDGSVVSGLHNGSIMWWDIQKRKMIRSMQAHGWPVENVCAMINGYCASTPGHGELYGEIKIWDSAGRCTRTIKAHNSQGLVTLSRTMLAGISADGTICVMNPFSGTLLGTIKTHDDHKQYSSRPNVFRLLLLTSGILVSGTNDGDIKSWR